MAQESKTLRKEVVQGRPAAEDLSGAIAQTLTKLADEELRIVRVFGDRYRCNWWVRSTSPNTTLTFSCGTIRRSSFVRATRESGELVIEELRAAK